MIVVKLSKINFNILLFSNLREKVLILIFNFPPDLEKNITLILVPTVCNNSDICGIIGTLHCCTYIHHTKFFPGKLVLILIEVL